MNQSIKKSLAGKWLMIAKEAPLKTAAPTINFQGKSGLPNVRRLIK